MDLRFFVRAFFSSGAGITRVLLAASLFCAVAAEALADRSGSDYLHPADARGGYLEPLLRTDASIDSPKTAQRLTYRAFDGQSYELLEHRGLFVRVLVPERADDGPFFTVDHLVELVDRLDELYSLYREILQLEPDGSGPLTVAFVPETCSAGCGLLGARGIEIRADAASYERIIAELDAGRLDYTLTHEMVHNFDAYTSYLHYLPDHAHAWTDFFQYFAAHRYGRNTLGDEAPDDLYNSPISAVWKQYVAEAATSWAACVRDRGCEDRGLSANNVWAMPYYRMEALYGTDAILHSLRFLSDYVQRFAAPRTAEQKEGLRILSLAHGAGTNIACQAEALKWVLPTDVAGDLERLFGPDDPNCQDRDGDGFVAMTGDCDENDAARHVLAEETRHNSVDDDCDGLTDEMLLQGTGSEGAFEVSLPFEVDGVTAGPDDIRIFRFGAADSQRVHVTLCTEAGFTGWAAALDSRNEFVKRGNWYTYRSDPGCSSVTFDYGELGRAAIAVIPDASGGDYSLTANATSQLPPDHSVYLQVLPRAGGGVRLQVDDPGRVLGALGADELEFWISGTDVRGSLPYGPRAAVTLDRYSAPQLANGQLYRARIRPKSGGQPLLAFSAAHLFRYDTTAPGVDGGYSGAWFDPDHEGEGFLVEVLGGGRALVYWFTYDAEGRQRWMVGSGAVVDGRIVVADMLQPTGGRFGADFEPADVARKRVGSLSISFSDCSQAVVNYSIDNVGGSQRLTRLTDVYGHACGAGGAPPAADLSGSWYDPAHDGEGFVLEQLGPDRAAAYWFSYDATGRQAWFFNSGTIDGDRIVFPDLLQASGAKFGRSFDPADVRLDAWGALELRLDCAGGTALYEPTARGFTAGRQDLVNLTRLENSGCGGL